MTGMRSLEGKVALLTGAGSGIGRCLAGELARKGARLILTDLSEEALQETTDLYGIQDRVLGTIVNDFMKEGEVERTAEEALRISPRIDILYNNAGIMVLGQVKNLLWTDIKRLQTVNQEAPIRLTHLVLPKMIERGGSHIVFTCSASAVATPPGAAAYGMAKAGVAAFAEAMRAEVHRYGISVTTICPGFVHTPLARSADYRDRKCEERTTNVPLWVGSTPEKVARVAVRAMIRRRALVVIGVDEHVKQFVKKTNPWLYGKINLLMARVLLDRD